MSLACGGVAKGYFVKFVSSGGTGGKSAEGAQYGTSGAQGVHAGVDSGDFGRGQRALWVKIDALPVWPLLGAGARARTPTCSLRCRGTRRLWARPSWTTTVGLVSAAELLRGILCHINPAKKLNSLSCTSKDIRPSLQCSDGAFGTHAHSLPMQPTTSSAGGGTTSWCRARTWGSCRAS